MLLDRHDAILSDLDGVVYAGPHAIEGAPQALNAAQDSGVPVAFVTNNASRSVAAVADHLVELGVATDADHVISSAQAAAKLLAQRCAPGTKVLITGAPALADCVAEAGLVPVYSQQDEPAAVVQGFNPEIGWVQLAEASYTLADPEVLWVASNTDLTIPKERGLAPGNGTLVGAVAQASGRTPIVAGKPESPIFHTAAQQLNSEKPLVIGDRLDTDILGAHRAGMASALVLTGVEDFSSVAAAEVQQRPTYIIETLSGLFEEYPEITTRTEGATVRAEGAGWSVEVEDGAVRAVGTGTEIDLWRVASQAWWAAHPHAEHPVALPEIIRD